MNAQFVRSLQRRRLLGGAVAGLSLTGVYGLSSGPAHATIRGDESVTLYPSHGAFAGNVWQFELRARINELERRSLAVAALDLLRDSLGLDGLNAAEVTLFHQRARLFLTDSERGKSLRVQIGGRMINLARTDEHGIAANEVEQAAARGRPSGWISVRTVLDNKDTRGFTGTVQLIAPSGISIISDVDDTIKITQVTDRQQMMRNTFARPFAPVPGMAERYAAWARSMPGSAFHYVSSSPWPLYEPLEAFRQASGFPPGTFHLRDLALAHLKSFAAPDAGRAHKSASIGRLIALYPQRRFWLIGDSGEFDPEIYGEFARRSPTQVERIYIRDMTNAPLDMERYRRAFEGVAPQSVKIIRLAEELPETPTKS